MAGTRNQVEGLPWYRAARAVGVGVDVDAMDQMDTDSLVDRARCYVTELPVNAVYEYDQDSAAAADAYNVVAPSSGVGRWILVSVSDSAPFITQSAWFVNPTTGSDANDGATALTAIKTLPELARRWAGRLLSPTILAATITLAAGTYPDPLTLQPNLPLSTQVLTIKGTMTELDTGSITGFTAWNSGTGTRCALTDATANFAATLKARIRMTSGAANGGVSWYNSTAAATIAQPNTFVSALGASSSTVTPAIADTYSLETTATILPWFVITGAGAGLLILADCEVVGSSSNPRNEAAMTGGSTRCRLVGMRFNSAAGIFILNANATLAGCMLDGASGASFLSATGITMQGFALFGGGLLQLSSGYFSGNNVMHDGNGTTTGCSLVVSNGARLEDIGTQVGHGFFGCVGGSSLAELSDFGFWTLSSASCSFWGAAGNTATVALKVFNGSGFTYKTLPTATGVAPGTDVVLSGAAGVAWATMPAIAAAPNNAYVNVSQ